MADPNTRQGKRTPVTLKIKFKSETLEQFIERYAVDVSQGGIFIRTKEPLAVGTQMKFEFQLRDASPLIAGEGTVVWTRENDPSRPAIAPGMGVRFDRLADGSQNVLEKILAEKAKQAPSRSGGVTAPGENKAAMFTDTPTRVAPAPVQESLGLRSRARSDSEQTPLPKPMPFHSDADDFDEKAFEEATKVRSLEELALQSAGLDGGDHDMHDDVKNATAIMPADELAARRQAGRGEDTDDPPLSSPPPDDAKPLAKAISDRDSAPGLPSPPTVDTGARAPRISTPPPRSESGRTSSPSTPPVDEASTSASEASKSGSTKLGIEPAKAATASAARSEAAPRAAIASETTHPTAPKRPSAAPIIIGILVVVAAVIGGVWWFVLREKVADQVAQPTTDTGSAVATNPGSGSDVVDTGSGSAGSAGAVTNDTGSGSAVVDTGSAGSAAVPAAPTVDTVITSVAKGATIEIIGTDQKGKAPFTAKLEKGKEYKARVTAPGFTASEIDVKGGEKSTAKLVLKPRIISVTTEPPGADIYVDGFNTQKLTPADVELTPSQAAKTRVRISVRRAGFTQGSQMVDAATFKDENTRMTASITIKLAQAVRPQPGTGGTGGTGGGSATGSGATGSGAGSATPSGDGGGTTPPAGGTTTPPAGGGTTTPPAGGTTTPPAGGGTTPPAGGTTTPPAGGTTTPPTGGSATPSATKPTEPEPNWTK